MSYHPPYNEARGTPQPTAVPPFDFQSVVMRFFPLKARMDRLQSFCDRYLNIVPREIAYFRPAFPYVTFMMVNYGKMLSDVENTGWVAQNEFLFTLTLDWMREENGELVHIDTTTVYPFIFVDEWTSQVTGREVYGWPKVHGKLVQRVDPWTRHPRDPRELMALGSMVFQEVFAGKGEEERIVIEVVQDPPPTVTEFPPDLDSHESPFSILPRAFMNSLQVASDAMDMAAAFPMRGFGSSWNPAALPTTLVEMAAQARFPWGRPYGNCVNLKQFRDAEYPESACYQALINSRMEVKRYNSGGMLDDTQLFLGDPSCGFRVKIHRYPTLPVIECLGLIIEEEHLTQSNTIATLKPVFPFWMDVDLRYGVGDVLAWRTRTGPWNVEQAACVPSLTGPADCSAAEQPIDEGADASHWSDPGHPYNTAQGAALLAMPGPFEFPNVALRIALLEADKAKLAKFCDDYLNIHGDHHRFEPWGNLVFLITESFTQTIAEQDDIGSWAKRTLRLSFPVVWKDADGDVISLALVTPYTFTDSQRATETAREVFGLPAANAIIECPGGSWPVGVLPRPDERLLRLNAEVLSASYMDQERCIETLLEVVSGPIPSGGMPVWPIPPSTSSTSTSSTSSTTDYGAQTGAEGEEEEASAQVPPAFTLCDAKALILHWYVTKTPLNEISLKQFRHSTDPLRACYQAIVLSRIELTPKEFDIIKPAPHVRIFRWESTPIVDILGLKVRSRHVQDGRIFECIAPELVFWVRGDARTLQAHNLCWRVGHDWHVRDHPDGGYFASTADMPITCDDVKDFEDCIIENWAHPNPTQHCAQNLAQALGGG